MERQKISNPFQVLGFTTPKNFCDRESELETLIEHFQNNRNVVLYSWRRLGKTLLIKRFIYEIENHHNAEAIYVDLMATQNMEEAISKIAEAVYNRFGKTQKGISASMAKLIGSLGLQLSFDAQNGNPTFSIGNFQGNPPTESLHAIGNFLKDRKKNIVIALDEFQDIVHYREKNREAAFRSWAQEFPQIHFLFSGSHKNMMVSLFSEKNRPFYRSAQLLSLTPIPLEKYLPFIQNHFSEAHKTIDTSVVESLYNWSKGQTYTVQMICNILFANYKNPNLEDLENVTERIVEQEKPIFQTIGKILTEMQWKTLKAIAKEPDLKMPTSKHFLTKHNLGAASSVKSALNMLMEKEIVVEENGVYFVQDIVFSKWLASLN
jgi:AAA+ ATPase superfamily predicted ATPase